MNSDLLKMVLNLHPVPCQNLDIALNVINKLSILIWNKIMNFLKVFFFSPPEQCQNGLIENILSST